MPYDEATLLQQGLMQQHPHSNGCYDGCSDGIAQATEEAGALAAPQPLSPNEMKRKRDAKQREKKRTQILTFRLADLSSRSPDLPWSDIMRLARSKKLKYKVSIKWGSGDSKGKLRARSMVLDELRAAWPDGVDSLTI